MMAWVVSKIFLDQLERIKKKICKIFENIGSKIMIENNLKITDFLDVTFYLKKWKVLSL